MNGKIEPKLQFYHDFHSFQLHRKMILCIIVPLRNRDNINLIVFDIATWKT